MAKESFKDRDLQYLLGNLLRIGVFSALAIVVLGVCVFFFQQGNVPARFPAFDKGHPFSIGDFGAGLLAGNGIAIITLGVLTLIATPVFRVIFAIIGFGKEKDRLYVGISAIVLGIILISILLGAIFS